MEFEDLPVNLSDVYAILNSEPVLNWYGLVEESPDTEELIRGGRSKLFTRANRLYVNLHRTYHSMNKNQYVVFVVPGLRNKYYNYRKELPEDEQPLLNISMERPMPRMMIADETKFQVFGDITPYDIVSVPLEYFVDRINASLPISIKLDMLNIIINFVYKPYDFWDSEEQRLIIYV